MPDIKEFMITGATHFAILPDGTAIFYRISNTVEIYLPICKRWAAPRLVPYTLYSLDDIGDSVINKEESK